MRWVIYAVVALTLAMELIVLSLTGCKSVPVKPPTDIILASTNIIRAQKPNAVILREVGKIEKAAVATGKTIAAQKVEIDKLKANKSPWWSSLIPYVLIGGGFFASVFLAWYGSKKLGVAVLVSSLAAGVAVKFIAPLLWFGLGILILLVVVAVVILVRRLRGAVEDVVPMVEGLKFHLKPKILKRYFGNGGFADKFQRPSTKEIVLKVREKEGYTKKDG